MDLFDVNTIIIRNDNIGNDIMNILNSLNFKKIENGLIYIPKINHLYDFICGCDYEACFIDTDEGTKNFDDIGELEIGMIKHYNETLQKVLPTNFRIRHKIVRDFDLTDEYIIVTIPFKLYIQAYNYHNKNNFDKDFIEFTKDYYNKIIEKKLKEFHDIAKY